jgi:hypothetical protein
MKGTLEDGMMEGEIGTGTGIGNEASMIHGPLLVKETRITEGLRIENHLPKIEIVEIVAMTAMDTETKTIAGGKPHQGTLRVSHLQNSIVFTLAFFFQTKITTLAVLTAVLLDLNPGLALATLEQDHQHIIPNALLVHAVVLAPVLAPRTQIAKDMMNTGLRGPVHRPSLPTAYPPAVRAHEDTRQKAHPLRNHNPN